MNAKQARICVAALLATAMLLPPPVNGTIAGLPAFCPAWSIFGVPCPFCGMTRSFVCIGHGNLTAALAYHPLGPALFVSLAVIAVAGMANGGYGGWRPSRGLTRLFLAIFVVTLGVAWVLRLSGFWPLPSH